MKATVSSNPSFIQDLAYTFGSDVSSAWFNAYDFGARLYDPSIGRWLSQDPVAENYYLHSPYFFCTGNPMKFVDPEGKDTYSFDLATEV